MPAHILFDIFSFVSDFNPNEGKLAMAQIARNVLLPPLEEATGDRGATTTKVKDSKLLANIDVKAKTLGYQLPHADVEIQRIEELQRARRDEFLKKRQRKPVQQMTQLSYWLDRHSDSTLQDLGLADSSVAVREVLLPKAMSSSQQEGQTAATQGTQRTMEEIFAYEDTPLGVGESEVDRRTASAVGLKPMDGLGVSRYQIRGDLKQWLSRVEELNERMILDAGDFSREEEQHIQKALQSHIAQALNKTAARDEFLMKQAVKSMCDTLETLTRKPFAVSSDKPVREQVQILDQLITDFYSDVIKKGGLLFGRPPAEGEGTTGGKKVESEGEIRKRQLAVGVAAAAQSQQILLTQAQLDQVLTAFYQQQLPSTKREKGRMERQLLQSLVREDNTTNGLRRRNKELTEEVEVLQETVKTLLEERASLLKQQTKTLIPTPTSQGGGPDALRSSNDVIQEMAEILAKKSVREAQQTAREECELKEASQRRCEELQRLAESQKTEIDTLQDKLRRLESMWEKQEEAKREQEEERRKLFGGMKSDQQYYQSTINKVLIHSAACIGRITALAAEDGRVRRSNCEKMDEVIETLDEWRKAVNFAFHFADASKAAADELVALCINKREECRNSGAELCQMPERAVPDYDQAVDRKLVNELSQRLDATLSEAKAKFREGRYVRNFLWYVIHCFEAMLNGTYSDEVHGKRRFGRRKTDTDDRTDHKDDVGETEDPFPPTCVVALDIDYAYAWSEEIQALERVFVGFRSRLGSEEAQQGEVNAALLRAIETVAEKGAVTTRREVKSSTNLNTTQPTEATAPSGIASPSFSSADVEAIQHKMSQLPVASLKDIRLVQALEDHQRLPSGARAVDVATELLLQIKQAKGNFQAPIPKGGKK